MRGKSLGMSIVIAVITLLLAIAVSAGDIGSPGASDVIRNATYVVNGTLTNGNMTGINNCELATYRYGSSILNSTTNASSLVHVGSNFTNTTTNQIYYSFSINTNSLEDMNDWVFSVLCNNFTSTGNREFSSRTGVTIDNSNPAVPSGLTSGEQTSTAVTLTGTVTNVGTTDCSMSFTSQSPINVPACTYSTSTCTCSLSNAPDYVYKYTITASDGSNRTTSEPATFTVKTKSGGASIVAKQIATGVKATKEVPTEKAKDVAKGFGQTVAKVVHGLLNALKSLFNR